MSAELPGSAPPMVCQPNGGSPGGPAGAEVTAGGGSADGAGPAAAAAVTELYQAHSLGLVRLAYVMLGSRAAAEDVVQEAFAGLCRHWAGLADPGRALPYVRSSVLNGCRSVLRRGGSAGRRRAMRALHVPPAASAESAVLTAEERHQVMCALRRLPDRQREAIVLRYYLDLPDAQIAADMGISPSTVRSTTHRALAALGRMLEDS